MIEGEYTSRFPRRATPCRLRTVSSTGESQISPLYFRRPKGINGLGNSGLIFVSPSVSEIFHDRVLNLCLLAGFTPRVVHEANFVDTNLKNEPIISGLSFLGLRPAKPYENASEVTSRQVGAARSNEQWISGGRRIV
jgi:hypothetical protein